jgi:hypothetical protein
VFAAPATGRLAPARAVGPYQRTAWHPLTALERIGLAAASRAIVERYREQNGWSSKARSPSSPRATRRSSKA